MEALEMHRELAAPEMMDFLQEGMVHVEAKLNMRMKKKVITSNGQHYSHTTINDRSLQFVVVGCQQSRKLVG